MSISFSYLFATLQGRKHVLIVIDDYTRTAPTH